MASDKREENKMQLKFLACLTGKFNCADFPYALNKLNLALTSKY
jgi:hypothetical protein